MNGKEVGVDPRARQYRPMFGRPRRDIPTTTAHSDFYGENTSGQYVNVVLGRRDGGCSIATYGGGFYIARQSGRACNRNAE